MASTSEVGHAKNVANLQTLIIDCQSFGTGYNPSNAAITVTALQALYTSASNAINDVAAKNNTLNHYINTRHVDFSTIKAKATQIMAALLASGANEQTMVNAQTINRKIQGSRATKKSAAENTTQPNTGSGSTPSSGGGSTGTTTPPPSTEKQAPPINLPVTPVIVSVSQQSFDNLVNHFAALVNYVAQYPAYNPNETDLTVTALNALVVYLTTSNNNVKTAQVALNNSRATRTVVLYDKTTGLVQVAKEVKGYIKSVFTASSPQYIEANAILFRTETRTTKHH